MDQYRENIENSAQDQEQSQEKLAPQIPDQESAIFPESKILEQEQISEGKEKDANYFKTQIQELEKEDYVPRPENVENLQERPIEEVIELFRDKQSGELEPVKLTFEEEAEKEHLKKVIKKMEDPVYEQQEVEMMAEQIKSEDFKKQAEQIIRIADKEGLRKAINALKRIDDPYVTDLVHDLFSVGSLWKRFKE